MVKTDELIQKNRELQKQLNSENESYYSDLVIYLRAKGTFKNDWIIEEKALEILQDILDSQQEGISAEEYFGKKPQEFADEIVKTAPVSFLGLLKLVFVALGVYSMFMLFIDLILPSRSFDFGTFAVVAVYTLVAALLLFWFIGTTVYSKKKKLSNAMTTLLYIVLLVGGGALSVFIKTPYQVKLVGIWGIVVILMLLLTIAILFFRQDKEDKKTWAPFIPVILSCAVIGIVSRTTIFSSFFETMTGKYTIAGVLILSLIIQYVLIYFYTRKLRSKTN
ncbi:hypothetical protein PMU66_03150 [Enterococcus durans]|uniref:hypothetical protein n=1 Tax=Enterococcus durans TaxID=53345 RepID=UPI0011935F87|nr:hypothetical protein [Enterococcus durans]MDB1652187.1 hypothetical protein [Enterococcus durans]MDB1655429.1 hypothetical protein [Enterococcus durans]MDB1663098.1 hypothetical protein [Enterococcus durans]MDB1668243.1 hypothetical protein [Enterococcus durans]MDB1670304.1 hypothetical protein [Enterococcus durans]